MEVKRLICTESIVQENGSTCFSKIEFSQTGERRKAQLEFSAPMNDADRALHFSHVMQTYRMFEALREERFSASTSQGQEEEEEQEEEEDGDDESDDLAPDAD